MKNFSLITTALFFAIVLVSTRGDFLPRQDLKMRSSPSEVNVLNRRFPIRLEGHRGAGDLEKENTLQAFKRAIEIGLDGVEIDIWLTKDKVPVVVHGAPGGWVEFMNGKFNISKINHEDLESLLLKNGERILSLEEVLDVCKDKITLNIEFKDPNEEIVGITLGLIQERNMLKQVTFSAFHHFLRNTLAEEVVKRGIRVPISFGFLSNVYQPRFPAYEDTFPGDALNIDVRFLRQNRERCVKEILKAKENFVDVKIWFPLYYVEKDLHYDEFMDLGVDTVITNNPFKGMNYFKSTIKA